MPGKRAVKYGVPWSTRGLFVVHCFVVLANNLGDFIVYLLFVDDTTLNDYVHKEDPQQLVCTEDSKSSVKLLEFKIYKRF